MKEIWKDIPGYEGLYQVSNLGMVKRIKILSRKEQRIIKQYADRSGYMTVYLYNGEGTRGFFLVHRLVAKVFVPNPWKKKEVNHIDGNKSNNTFDNLEWSTRSENILHASKSLGKIMGVHKPVRCIETNKVYPNMCIASKHTGVARSSINEICLHSNPHRKTAGGYHWEFI